MINEKFISSEPIIYDWIEDNPLSQDMLSRTQLKRWVHNIVKDFTTVDLTKHNITVLQLNNTKAELPDDYHTLISVGYRVYKDKKNCTPVEKVVEYTQNLHSGCSLKIRTECTKCNKLECTCDSKREIIEVDTDKIFQMENPWYYNSSKFNKPYYSRDLVNDTYDNKNYFQLMSYSTSDFHNVESHVPDCVNLHCKDCEHKFVITPPFIETDIMIKEKDSRCELLLAYYGRHVGQNGDLLIPNSTDAIEAITYHLDYMYYRSLFKKEGGQVNQTIYNEAYQKRDLAIARLKTDAAIPDLKKFEAEMRDIFKAPKLVY